MLALLSRVFCLNLLLLVSTVEHAGCIAQVRVVICAESKRPVVDAALLPIQVQVDRRRQRGRAVGDRRHRQRRRLVVCRQLQELRERISDGDVRLRLEQVPFLPGIGSLSDVLLLDVFLCAAYRIRHVLDFGLLRRPHISDLRANLLFSVVPIARFICTAQGLVRWRARDRHDLRLFCRHFLEHLLFDHARQVCRLAVVNDLFVHALKPSMLLLDFVH